MSKVHLTIIALSLTLFLLAGSSLILGSEAQRQQLPILLIHGYGQDQRVWNSWITWLEQDNIP